jgi:tetratricopeptide (TPR) repeat protein
VKHLPFLQSEHDSHQSYRAVLISLFLALIILITFWNVQYYDFVYDDGLYITNNIHIKTGLRGENILWAFTTTDAGYWHPLTWLSHMLDYQLFRSNAGGHHWTNLIFHMANAVLLYVLLRRTTGDVWKSAFVAALFAVHPLNVESVAWVAERKNVLSTFFWLMTMWAYAFYVEHPAWYRYVLVLLAFMLGLMAKPMLVTLPFVLLLLDYWPLRRLTSWQDMNRLVFEKIPLFILTLIVSIFTFLSTRHEGAVISFDVLSFGDRVFHVIVSYVKYLGKTFWPENLAVFYPYLMESDWFQIAGASAILLIISCLVIFLSRRYPYALWGWLWYLGTLVPVIGFIQAGDQAMADRYMYVPGIGLFIMIAWGIPDLLKKWPKKEFILIVSAGAVLCISIICTFIQVTYWKNSVTLFERALNVTRDNYLAHNNLGVALLNQGKSNDAGKHFARALQIKRDYPAAHNNMGLALASQGKIDEAISYYRSALRIKSNDEKARNNLGTALARMGRYDEAKGQFQETLRINPGNADAYNNIGSALAMEGKVIESLGYFEKALQLDHEHAMAHNNMGLALANLGRLDEAVDHFMKALEVRPDYREAYDNLNVLFNKIKIIPKASVNP